MLSLSVNRPVYNVSEFNNAFESNADENTTTSRLVHTLRKNATCSCKKVWMKFVSFVPIFIWLPKYKSRYIFGDLISGWTVGIIRIPQGMAYALLTGVAPVYGLYTSFFSVLLWFIFSTSKHTSVGTMAIVCLMVRTVVDKYSPPLEFYFTSNSTMEMLNATQNSSDSIVERMEFDKIQVAASVTLLVGIVQLCMGILHLGFLTNFLSDPVVQGFTTGSAFHVMTSQVKYVFGLDKQVRRHVGPFALLKTYWDIFSNLNNVNIAEIIISALCLPAIFFVKYLNVKYKKELKNIPFPIELLLVIIGTCACYFGRLDQKFNVNIVSDIPTGFPAFETPKYVHLWGHMFIDAIIIAVVSFAITMSLTKLFADKHGYEVDTNQELVALGICNIIPSFLSSFAIAASLSRTAIQESSGGHTQIVSFLSSFLMLAVLLWLGPLFESAPKAVLACIIIAALQGLFMQFKNLKPLWRISKIDFVVWIVTMLAVVFLGVDLGLACGVASALFALLFRIKRPSCATLGRLGETEIYADVRKFPEARETPGVKIFSFKDSPTYNNKEAFKEALYKSLGFNPALELVRLKKANKPIQSRMSLKNRLSASFASKAALLRSNTNENNFKEKEKSNNEEETSKMKPSRDNQRLLLSHLIIDASRWSYIDSTAAKDVMSVIAVLAELNVEVYFAAASSSILSTLANIGLDTKYTIDQSYVSIHDACLCAAEHNRADRELVFLCNNENSSDEEENNDPMQV